MDKRNVVLIFKDTLGMGNEWFRELLGMKYPDEALDFLCHEKFLLSAGQKADAGDGSCKLQRILRVIDKKKMLSFDPQKAGFCLE